MMEKAQISLGLLGILGVLIIILLFFPGSPFQLAIQQKIDFAGFTWQVDIQDSGSVNPTGDNNEFVELRTSRNNVDGSSVAQMTTDITGIDEVLVIGEGDAHATAFRASSSAAMQVLVRGSEGGEVELSSGVTASSRGSESAQTVNKHIDARIFKFKNNFDKDGTWSALESLGVGDVFIVRSTKAISGTPMLILSVNAGNGGIASGQTASSSITAKFFNVVRKESAFAVCKADEFIQDINQDGKITSDECFDFDTIVLNSEEAIKESTNEKLERIEQELLQKQEGLEKDSLELQKQLNKLQEQQASDIKKEELLDRIVILEEELKETNQRLADVQAKDKNVIAVIESEEQFEEPNFLKKILNKIIAFFKNLF